MPKEMLICKTCGKEYEACRTPNRGIPRWRDVACSLECAAAYFRAVAIARGEIVEEPAGTSKTTEPVAEAPVQGDEAPEQGSSDSSDEPAEEKYTYRFNKSRRK